MISKVPIPASPAPETLELLVRARLLLAHAVSHAENPVGVDSLIAVHGLDNVVEFTLRLLSLHLDFEVISGGKFPSSELAEMAGTLDRFLLENYAIHLPYITEIKTLRQVRNLVQHGAMDPGADLRRSVTLVERFFSRVTTMVFGLESSELAISRIVRDRTVCGFLQEAEKALVERRYLDAVVACRDAFDNALFVERRDSELWFWATTATARVPARDLNTPLFFDTLVDELEATKLHIHGPRYRRFRKIVNDLPVEYGADPVGAGFPRDLYTPDEARYCYSFATEQVLRWQSERFVSSEQIPERAPQRLVRHFFNDVEIPQSPDRAERLHAGDGEFYIAYVPEESGGLFGYRSGETCRLRFEAWAGDTLVKELSYDVTMVSSRSRLRTHRPPRWELCLFFRQLPFTWHEREYANGNISKESLCINSAREEELATMNDIIGTKLARKIVFRRRKIGEITSVNDLRSIAGITEAQIRWLADFTRL